MAIMQLLEENIRNLRDTVFQHQSQQMKWDSVSTLIIFQPLHCEEF